MGKKKKSDSEPINQAVLFNENELPHRDDLVELVRRGFSHTAKNLMENNQELCRQVMIALIQRVPTRRIARTFKISRNSVAGIRQEMEKRGLVEPLKKEISAMLGAIITMGLEDFQDALATGELHPSQLPVPMGIFMTHKALMDGDPTVRVDNGKPSELSVESVRAYWEQMKKAKAELVTVDSESTVKPPETP